MSETGDVRADITRWRTELRAHGDERSSHRVLVAASCTTNAIDPGLGLALLDHTGAVPEILHHEYNQIFQLCLSPAEYVTDDVDDLVIIWRAEDVFERDVLAWSNGDTEALERIVTGAASLGRAVADCSRAVDARVIASDAPVPVGSGFDHRDPTELTDLIALQHAANAAFDQGLADAPVERLRLGALQHATGTVASFDRRNWLMYRQPFPSSFAHLVGRSIADVIVQRTRAAPKVLVLDCDNTIWGGIAVDDGIGGLQAGDAFPGTAYRAFQVAVRRLRHRGVLLALVSKNDPETVERAFEQVDGMVLTDEDIAGRRISWDPKPQGIADLANEFHLGLDSFVFVDDSPYEIGSVNQQLVDVRTLLVPEDIEALPDLLAESGWFRNLRVTDDDRERTARMQAESGRAQAATAMTHDEFLASLHLTVRRIEVGPSDLTRVTQLVNKTNQFNLTTIRRSESEIADLVADPDAMVLAYAADDRFGEYGIIGVVIGLRDAGTWHLDTVLMSCRVLGRGVETAMLADAIATLRRDGDAAVTGTFSPTDRNGMVADLLADHGFDADDEPGRFILPSGRAPAVPAHVEVTSR
jgi:FkbH-like protein